MRITKRLREMRAGELIILAGLTLLIVLQFSQLANILRLLFRAVMPLIVGAIIAFILNLIVRPIERIYFPNTQKRWIRKSRRPVAIVLALLAVLLILALVVWLIVPQLYATIKELTARLPVDYERLKAFIAQNFGSIPELQQLPSLPADFGQQIPQLLARFAGGIVNVAGSVAESVFEFVVAFIFAIFLLASRDLLARQFNRVLSVYFPDRVQRGVCTFLAVADDTFSRFFIGQAIEAVILGVLCIVGMLILGFPNAFMIGTVIGITALIPLIGAYIGGAAGFIIIAAEGLYKALGFLLFLVILQQMEGDVIYPRVVGSSIGLPGIWVFVAVVVGGALFGIPGIIFGVPITATAYKLLQRDIRSRDALAEPDDRQSAAIRKGES